MQETVTLFRCPNQSCRVPHAVPGDIKELYRTLRDDPSPAWQVVNVSDVLIPDTSFAAMES
jgi:hypothetical protein